MGRARSSVSGWWWPLAFIAVAWLLFWPVLGLTAFSDDHSALWNAGVRGIPWRNGFFRPLSDASFHLGTLIWGSSVGWHRAFNVVVHGINAYLLFVLMGRWAGKRIALPAAILFLLYPFHQESIVWLVGRESALGAGAVLAGLVLIGSGTWSAARSAVVGATLLVGTLCYESAFLLIPIALLVAWSGVIAGWPNWRMLVLPLGLPVVVHLLLRWQYTGLVLGGYFDGLIPDDPGRQFMHLPKVLGRLFLPPDPDQGTQLVSGAILLILLMATHPILRRRLAVSSDRLLTLLGLLVLVACTVAFVAGVSTVTSESDRFLYLPSAFLCAMGGVWLSAIPRSIIRCSVLAVLSGLCYWQLRLNHRNWMAASRITQTCVVGLPAIYSEGCLWISGLPDSFNGAYVFRNGFPEAVDLAGGNGDRIIVVPNNVTPTEAVVRGVGFRGAVHRWHPADRWFRWNGTTYVRSGVQ